MTVPGIELTELGNSHRFINLKRHSEEAVLSTPLCTTLNNLSNKGLVPRASLILHIHWTELLSGDSVKPGSPVDGVLVNSGLKTGRGGGRHRIHVPSPAKVSVRRIA